MDFSLQDTGGAGWGSVSENYGTGSGDTGTGDIYSTLENIGVNFAAGAASVGLGAISKSAGVSSPYPSYNLSRPPGSLPAYGAGVVGGNGVVLVGVLLVGGLLLFAAFGRKG